MEYFLTEEQKTIKSLARKIAEERILPVRAELDEKEEFPWEIIKDLAKQTGGYSFLDVGAGTGLISKIAKKYFQIVIALDVSQEMLNQIKDKSIINFEVSINWMLVQFFSPSNTSFNLVLI